MTSRTPRWATAALLIAIFAVSPGCSYLNARWRDFTDIMSVWGDVKLNRAVWGYANTVQSAAASLLGLPLEPGR